MKLENSLKELSKIIGSGIPVGIVFLILLPHIAIPLFSILLVGYLIITLFFVPDEPDVDENKDIIDADFEELDDDK